MHALQRAGTDRDESRGAVVHLRRPPDGRPPDLAVRFAGHVFGIYGMCSPDEIGTRLLAALDVRTLEQRRAFLARNADMLVEIHAPDGRRTAKTLAYFSSPLLLEPPARPRRGRRIALAATALAAVTGAGWWLAPTAHRLPAARTTVESADVPAFAGSIQPVAQIPILARASGSVQAIRVHRGDTVRPGDEILRLDDEEASKALADRVGEAEQAERSLAALRARMGADTRDRRDEDGSGAAAARLYRQRLAAALAVAAADERARHAREALAKARDRVERMHVRSEVDGTVDELLVQAGDAVRDGAPLLRVVVSRSMHVRLDVPASRGGVLYGGQRARVTVDGAGRTFDGRIVSLMPSADGGATCSVDVEVEEVDPAVTGRPARVQFLP